MEAIVRPAQPADADGIMLVIHASLGDDTTSERILSVLGDGTRTTLVALLDGRIVGFVDGFLTTSQSGMLRAELDLLGVLPDVRGRGIGRILVQEFVRLISAGHSELQIRVLVAHNNESMHRVMIRTGFSSDRVIYGLFVRDVDSTHPAGGSGGHLVPVQTLTYSGIWLEGHFTSDSISAANALGLAIKHDIIGALMPLTDMERQDIADRSGFMQVGTFQWWFLSP